MNAIEQNTFHSEESNPLLKYNKGLDETLINIQSTDVQNHFSSKKGMMKVAKAFPGFKKAIGMTLFMLFSLFAYAQTSVNFNYTGAVQNWVVPPGVTCVNIVALGAQGGTGIDGGLGGYVSAELSVTPNQVLNINVGGAGIGAVSGVPSGGGFNGGGDATLFPGNAIVRSGGGGASDIRVGGNALGSRVIVAGGGGGGCSTVNGNIGGAGGGLSGNTSTGANPGGGGTQLAGGASGFPGCTPGISGQGGSSAPNIGCAGGGGGWFGGGAGCGAGGGSSYYGGPGVTGGITISGVRTGNGLVQINYSPLALDCPGDLIFNLASGECSKHVNFEIEVEGSCGNAVITSPSGHSTTNNEFPIGPTLVQFQATENGVIVNCSFTVTVVENVPDNNSLSCGDLIHVSMDEDCQFNFTADYLLTGNDYHCFDDYDTYVMECHTCDTIPTSPIITSDYIGDTLVGKVCDPETGICCWGYIVPEDKGDPSLCWADFTMSCTGETHPDSISGITKTYPYTGGALPIPDASSLGPDSVCLFIDVECDTLPLIDLIVNLSITHPMAPGDLTAKIKSPGGTEANLSLITPTTPAIPIGTNASGTWKITIYDNIENGSIGTVTGASLEIEANYAKPIPIDNCDNDMTPTWTDVISDPNCDGDCYQTITRTWCVTDDSGNEFCCDQIICLTRPNLEDLVCPPDYDGMPGSEDMLSCTGGFPTDPNGHPDPSYTGSPKLEGFDVDGFCMFYCIYEDDSIGVCEGSYIIVREWECWDWCTGEDTTCTQIIKIFDNDPPVIICPDSISLNANDNCIASTTLPPPVITDSCSNSGIGYSAYLYSGGGDLIYSGGNWILSDIPIGTTTVCYAAFDGCENRDTCYFDIIVSDGTPPTAICETWHTVGISGSPSWYDAIDFDDGSQDECSSVTFEVRRFTNPNCTPPDGQATAFGPQVPFYCCEVGDTVLVELKVTDASGNMNFCTSHVIVEDNVVPTHINCPADTSVTCDANIDDIINLGGEPQFSDNCDIDTIILTIDSMLTSCGNGMVFRKWVAIDVFGNKDSCEQKITLGNTNPFTIVDTECWSHPSSVTTDGVEWPCDILLLSCGDGLHPDSLDLNPGVDSFNVRPRLFPNSCEQGMVTATWNDGPDISNPNECFKFIRTWSVFNTCAPNPTVPVATFGQMITILSSAAPVITSVCEAPAPSSTVPDSTFLIFTATDDCTPDNLLVYSYQVDLFDDGPPLNDFMGNINDASNAYPAGIHRIYWEATDECGQSVSCDYLFLVNSQAPPTFNVSGGIENEEGAEVEYVAIEVEGDNMQDVAMTGDDGTFGFNLPSIESYTITPERDDNILNGVSTYDLVLMSKHILQLEMLSSAYKIIAADVNHSGTVSTIDMVALRRVILFIDDEFPNNTSWRFVDAEFVFPDPTDPFATSFPEIYTINGLTEDEVADFVGVKIGDLNCSAAPNDLVGSGDDRNADGELIFTLADQSLTAGETYQFEFEATDFDQVQGFQFTMSYNENAIEFNDVEAGDLANISDASFGLHKLNEGIITASWNASGESQTLENEKVLFSFSFTALEDGQLSELININSRFTKAEAYNHKGLLDLSLQFADESGTITAEQFELYQNQPNPFKDETVIGFNLPEGGKATFKVFDISGRVIKSVEGDYSKGYNEISINRSELQSSGVLYYQLESAEHIGSKKMVLLD